MRANLFPSLAFVSLLAAMPAAPASACESAAECDDAIPCTADTCEEAGNMSGEKACFHTPNHSLCADSDPCTTDTCSTIDGCTHAPTVCEDSSNCTDDICTPGVGCQFPSSCDDGIACTTDSCGPAGNMSGEDECKHDPVNSQCDDADPCTTDTCSTFSGCTHEPVVCEDTSNCTDDICTPGVGCQFPSSCDDGIPCTTDSCGPAGNMSGEDECKHARVDALCNDDDLCTNDSCTFSGCANVPIDCDDGDACTNDGCSAGSCQHTPVDCNDDDACTIDQCVAGSCTCEVDTSCAAQGCAAGYWKANALKKNANAWPAAIQPGTKIKDFFDVPTCIGSSAGEATLSQGLSFRGGKLLSGAASDLLRVGVAALLNASSTCVQFPLCPDEVIDQVEEALATCNRQAILDAAAALEQLNRLECPLDQNGVCLND